jgi:lipid II isoglutaminyl synthase (glutamine-hydrolysing)
MATVRILVAHPLLAQGQGDEGNALVLAHRAARRGIVAETAVHHGPGRLPAAEIYLLGGAEDALLAALAEALRAGGLVRAIDAGAVVLAVDAAFQVLCRAFVSAEGVTRDGVGVFDAVSHRAASAAEGPVITRPNERLGLPAMSGFESHLGRTEPDPGVAPLAEIELGIGNGTSPGAEASPGTPSAPISTAPSWPATRS